jgi:cell division septum initiation protein DivIVA
VLAEAEAKAALRMREVDGIVDEARARAQHIEAEAEERAAQTVAEAERLLDDARREAKRIRQESERYRSEMQAHLAGVRDLLDDTSSSSDVDLVVDLREDATAPAAPSDTHGPST